MNIHKIILLYKRYCIENRRKLLQTLLGIFLGTAVISFLCSNETDGLIAVPVCIAVFIAMYLASTIFSIDLSRKENALHYLLVPANSYEKLVANLIIVHIFVNLVLLLTLFAGIIVGSSLWSLYFQEKMISFHILQKLCVNILTIDNILEFIGFQATFIFGSVYFRRRAFIKTFLSLVIFSLGISLLGLLIFTVFRTGPGYYYLNTDRVLSEWNNKLTNMVWILGCWVLTFFRLKETEI